MLASHLVGCFCFQPPGASLLMKKPDGKDCLHHEDAAKRFSLQVCNTKIHTFSAARAVASQHRKVCKHLQDLLSHHLVQCWWERHHKARAPEDYFFPYWTQGEFNWSKPMSNDQHNKAVQACAGFLQLTDACQFTSTAIRRGNALTTEQEVQRIRSQRNLACAWAQRSTVALLHYCPPTVMANCCIRMGW